MNRINDNLICTAANEEIVQAFVAQDVQFIVIGGLAMAWYCPTRQADDMDLLVASTPENAVKVFRALSALHIPLAGLDEQTFARAGGHAPLKRYYYTDVLTPRSDDLSFDELLRDSVPGKLFGHAVRLPSLRHLIKLKESAAARQEKDTAKHESDLNLLRTLLRRETHR